jgi:hypothetical protein
LAEELVFDFVGETRTGEDFVQQWGGNFAAEFEGAG